MGRNKQTPGATDSPELAEYKAEQPETSVNAFMARFALPLMAAKVAKVTVSYSGSGDSGQIDEVDFRTGRNEFVDVHQDVSPVFYKSFEDFLYALLDRRGWNYNNDGGQGVLIWDISKDVMDHRHEDNVIQVEKTTYEGIEDLIGGLDPGEVR